MLEEREGRAAIDARIAASQVPLAPTSKLALEMSVPELHKGILDLGLMYKTGYFDCSCAND